MANRESTRGDDSKKSRRQLESSHTLVRLTDQIKNISSKTRCDGLGTSLGRRGNRQVTTDRLDPVYLAVLFLKLLESRSLIGRQTGSLAPVAIPLPNPATRSVSGVQPNSCDSDCIAAHRDDPSYCCSPTSRTALSRNSGKYRFCCFMAQSS